MPVWLEIALACLTFLSTMILLGITWKYVRLTKQILQSTNKPKIMMFLRARKGRIYLCIQNIGVGYAMDVRFTGSLDFQPGFEEKQLKDIEPYKSGIDYFGSGHKIETFLFNNLSSLDIITNALRGLEKPLEITVTYKNSSQKQEDPYNFKLNFSEWNDSRHFIMPAYDEISDALESINNTIRDTLSRR